MTPAPTSPSDPLLLRIPTITMSYAVDSFPLQPSSLQPILQFKDSDSPSHNQRHRAWKEWLEGQRRKEAARSSQSGQMPGKQYQP